MKLKVKKTLQRLDDILNKMESSIDEKDPDDIKWAEKEYDAGIRMRAKKLRHQLEGQDPLVFNPKELIL
jgi:uncharacterized membrane protein YgaE (UPF0421/DUF939 family)